jgi:hypothetical protein
MKKLSFVAIILLVLISGSVSARTYKAIQPSSLHAWGMFFSGIHGSSIIYAPADTVKIDEKTLKSYVGSYYLSTDPKRIITINKTDKGLFAILSPKENVVLVPVTETNFKLKTVVPKAELSFVVEKGVIKKMIVHQNGANYDWIRKA